jgi:hypothetical protein
MLVTQYSKIPFEIFTIDDLYTDEQVDTFTEYVKNADASNRTFTNSPFKNGKVIQPDITKIMWEHIKTVLPPIYVDRGNIMWEYIGTPHIAMYATIKSGQKFGLHTDTGVEYSVITNKYSKYTLLTYLNHDFEGGHTRFYDMEFNETCVIEPRRNRTLIFDIELFHCGEMVIKGEKHWIGSELVCGKL